MMSDLCQPGELAVVDESSETLQSILAEIEADFDELIRVIDNLTPDHQNNNNNATSGNSKPLPPLPKKPPPLSATRLASLPASVLRHKSFDQPTTTTVDTFGTSSGEGAQCPRSRQPPPFLKAHSESVVWPKPPPVTSPSARGRPPPPPLPSSPKPKVASKPFKL